MRDLGLVAALAGDKQRHAWYNSFVKRQIILWLGPQCQRALEFLREKHGHTGNRGAAAAIRFAIHTVSGLPSSRLLLSKIASTMGVRAKSGGTLACGHAPDGWKVFTPRLADTDLEMVARVRRVWHLPTDQAAIRFAILAAAIRDGFDDGNVPTLPGKTHMPTA